MPRTTDIARSSTVTLETATRHSRSKFSITFSIGISVRELAKTGGRGTVSLKKSSLGTCCKIFRLLFERATCEKIPSKLGRSMRRVIGRLAKEHGLSDQARAKRIMTIDQLKQHIEETLSTIRKTFGFGEVRLLAVLFFLLVAPAGSCRTVILRLRFRDISIVLVRDPEGGPHKLRIRFILKFTKEYLGSKAHPQIFPLGILFRHRAFRVPSLTSLDHLKKPDICSGDLELHLPLREGLNDTYIFRRAILFNTVYVLSTNEPIYDSMMGAWFRRIGEILGSEYSSILYSLRYNAANGFDQSADVSEARNLVVGHASSDPFRHHYLGREIGADLWGDLRGQN
ncbi:c2h2 finger domain protein [Colletotrichum incanum]|uniref:C2h2 finger domain protein n=1 Tax=Colletotrichum incanum TaxID=1573173 RepID=A0A167BV11_COLIC|nr:c2h2 finger domain protein [Colletotrichum incanum]